MEDSFEKTFICDGIPVRVTILNTAGSLSDNPNILHQWIKQCDTFILVLAVDSSPSFNLLLTIYAQIVILKGGAPPCVLAGNTKKYSHQVPKDVANMMATEFGNDFYFEMPFIDNSVYFHISGMFKKAVCSWRASKVHVNKELLPIPIPVWKKKSTLFKVLDWLL
ncbi:hypothetical protein CPB84DRAFT_1858915 [Gymnopilus junonius]|uniref:Uncharacterized protein n=1 Tax=Gymnopilus junonius TaxID=109634 RepID=A0A9P5N8G6_GYMJU|nr:hypothetical protein CPB84DRAFT_1858915 [Gymnopilus junonius]